MRFQFCVLLVVSVLSFSGCFGSGEEAPVNKAPGNSASPSAQTTPEANVTPKALEKDIVNAAPVPTIEAVTLKPLIAAFCKARRDKDEPALRKLYSAATLRNLSKMAGEEGKNSIIEYLEEEPIGSKCNVYNERIVGDTGEATVVTDTYPNGVRWTFVKENSDWKLTDQSSDFDKVKKAAQ